MTTERTIEIIDSLFTEDQRTTLEFEANNFKVTIKEQLKAKFADQFPMYNNENKIKVISANIIRSQEHLLNVIKEKNKYLEIWKDPLNYSNKKTETGKGETRNKVLNYENTQKATESIASIKSRQGEATRSFDYIGEEAKWDREDNLNFSMSNIQLNFRKILNEDVTTAKVVQAYQEQNAPAIEVSEQIEKELTQSIIEPREEAYLNSITINKSRTQQRNKKLETIEGLRDTQNKRDSKSEMTQSIESINAINSWSLEVVDLMDRFFNSFNVLFSDYPQCFF